uniref:Uncharacterized protein n=1 Tax=Catharus ustulatus TaxID=91951 RepID=A0A8C3TTA8_CATUS
MAALRNCNVSLCLIYVEIVLFVRVPFPSILGDCLCHLVFTYILASVPFLKALFVSFMFLVWIILKYEIHLGNILYIHVEG